MLAPWVYLVFSRNVGVVLNQRVNHITMTPLCGPDQRSGVPCTCELFKHKAQIVNVARLRAVKFEKLRQAAGLLSNHRTGDVILTSAPCAMSVSTISPWPLAEAHIKAVVFP